VRDLFHRQAGKRHGAGFEQAIDLRQNALRLRFIQAAKFAIGFELLQQISIRHGVIDTAFEKALALL
jgi:hypothetical protein